MSNTTAAMAYKIPPMMAMDGTKSPVSSPRTVRSTKRQYINTPTKTPITNWMNRSLEKLASTRGEYWLAASDNATMVVENTTPATVIIDVAMADRMSRDAAALAPKRRGQRSVSLKPVLASNSVNPMAADTESNSTSAGITTGLTASATRATERGSFGLALVRGVSGIALPAANASRICDMSRQGGQIPPQTGDHVERSIGLQHDGADVSQR